MITVIFYHWSNGQVFWLHPDPDKESLSAFAEFTPWIPLACFF